MQLLRLKTLSIACFISLGLVSCGGGSSVPTSSISVTNSTFAFDENNNLYLSNNGTDYSLDETTGRPAETSYTTQAGSDMAAIVGTAGVISVSSDLKSWSNATSPTTTKVNGLTLSLPLYSVIAVVEEKKSANSTSVGASSAVQASAFAAVGALGNIQVVFPAFSSLTLSQAVKEHKLKYRQIASVTNKDLFSVAEATDGNIVGVGADNTGVISTDGGKTFTAFTLPTTSTANTTLTAANTNYYDVATIGPNQDLVVVGGDGMLQTSPDGKTWTPQNIGTTKTLLTANYQGNNYVVGGFDSTLMYSRSVKNPKWIQANIPKQLRDGKIDIRDIATSVTRNGRRLMTAYCVSKSSSSGKTLSARDIFLRKYSLTDADSQVILISYDDGENWTEQSVSASSTLSSAAIPGAHPLITSIQDMFKNPDTPPAVKFAGKLLGVTLGPIGFVLGNL